MIGPVVYVVVCEDDQVRHHSEEPPYELTRERGEWMRECADRDPTDAELCGTHRLIAYVDPTILEPEREAALARCCELWGPGTRAHELAPCEHCTGCLDAINAAAEVWGKAQDEQLVEDARMGCVACFRGLPETHLDGFIGHNVPAFKRCPVKRADL